MLTEKGTGFLSLTSALPLVSPLPEADLSSGLPILLCQAPR